MPYWNRASVDDRCPTVARPASERSNDDDDDEYVFNGFRQGPWSNSRDTAYVDDRCPTVVGDTTASRGEPLSVPLVRHLLEKVIERRKAEDARDAELKKAWLERIKARKEMPRNRLAEQRPDRGSPHYYWSQPEGTTAQTTQEVTDRGRRLPESTEQAGMLASREQPKTIIRIIGINGEERLVTLPRPRPYLNATRFTQPRSYVRQFPERDSPATKPVPDSVEDDTDDDAHHFELATAVQTEAKQSVKNASSGKPCMPLAIAEGKRPVRSASSARNHIYRPPSMRTVGSPKSSVNAETADHAASTSSDKIYTYRPPSIHTARSSRPSEHELRASKKPSTPVKQTPNAARSSSGEILHFTKGLRTRTEREESRHSRQSNRESTKQQESSKSRYNSERQSARSSRRQRAPSELWPTHTKKSSPEVYEWAREGSISSGHTARSYRSPEEPTVFAGTGWISPHPLSTIASEAQSFINLPMHDPEYGKVLTYEQWQHLRAIADGAERERPPSKTRSDSTKSHQKDSLASYRSGRVPSWHLYETRRDAHKVRRSDGQLEQDNHQRRARGWNGVQTNSDNTWSTLDRLKARFGTGRPVVHLRMPWDTDA